MRGKNLIAFVVALQIFIVLTMTSFADNIDASEGGISLHYLDPELSQIYAGANHSVAVNNWGCVKTYGDNTYKQLGTTHYDENYSNEYYVTIPEDVQKISTLLNHNLALAEGNIYAWGDNSYYQLGHKEGNTNAIPTKIDYFDNLNIIDVAAGGWFSLALASDGNVYAWGDNKYGQLAKGTTGGSSAIPCTVRDMFVEETNVVAFLNDIEKISAGKYHALALRNNGEVYGWGRNSTDHCISDTDNFTYSIATRIQGLPLNIVEIEAGDRCSFFITDEGRVYAMGNNSTGQLGDGTNITRSTPILLDIENVVDIESNGGSTLFLTSDGTVFACGANEYGQLGQGYANTRIETPAKVPCGTFTKIAAGGDHNLLYRCNEEYPEDQGYYRNATIYAMGRNDSGQCMWWDTNNITYPTIVYEIENTEDVGQFAWNDNNLRPIDATYIAQHEGNQDQNFYGNSVLKVNYTNRENDSDRWGEYAYLKFDISNVEKEHIKSAKLNLYVENGTDNRKSVREIGVYDTYVNNWDGSTMTWNKGRVGARSLLGSFNVTATGHMIEDVGWHEVDITEYLKNEYIDNELSLILKSISTQAYETIITSGIYKDSFEHWDKHNNKNIPVLEIKYDDEADITINRSYYSPSSDTYIFQREPNKSFSGSEFLSINYTPNTQSSNWGQDSYLSFDIKNITVPDRKKINRATLWLYVDEASDCRDSIRTVNISANDGLNYNSDTLIWNMGRPIGQYDIEEFSVEGNGFNIVNSGWRKIDVTDFIKSSKKEDVEFILKMTSAQAHPVKIRSSEHSNIDTRPQLVIDRDLSMEKLSEDISGVHCTDAVLHGQELYKYIPNSNDDYIFSSVNGVGLSAILFDENMNELSASDNIDGNFKIEHYLEKNKIYYINVSSVSEADVEYSFYVETPLTITIQ